jgi:hypothetical protein
LKDIPIPNRIDKVEIFKQHEKIDVFCVINDEYPIIIEDKTNTENHSNQLERYFEFVKKRYDPHKIIPIYFKTGDQDDYKNIKENGYSLFLRIDFIKILNKGLQSGIKNHIFIDYANHLKKIEDERNSYKLIPIDEWYYDSWIGFYKELKEKLGTGNWNYVSNPSGGFLAFHWNWINIDGGEKYIQIEEEKFCFKIWVKNKERRYELREKIHKKTIQEAGKHDIDVIRPDRFGYGEWMTVAVFKGDYRITNSENIIDMDLTVENIKKIEKGYEGIG